MNVAQYYKKSRIAFKSDRGYFDKQLIISTYHKNLLKGIKLKVTNIIVGQDNEDFINDLYTVFIEYKLYKVSRIISNYLLNKINNAGKRIPGNSSK